MSRYKQPQGVDGGLNLGLCPGRPDDHQGSSPEQGVHEVGAVGVLAHEPQDTKTWGQKRGLLETKVS